MEKQNPKFRKMFESASQNRPRNLTNITPIRRKLKVINPNLTSSDPSASIANELEPVRSCKVAVFDDTPSETFRKMLDERKMQPQRKHTRLISEPVTKQMAQNRLTFYTPHKRFNRYDADLDDVSLSIAVVRFPIVKTVKNCETELRFEAESDAVTEVRLPTFPDTYMFDDARGQKSPARKRDIRDIRWQASFVFRFLKQPDSSPDGSVSEDLEPRHHMSVFSPVKHEVTQFSSFLQLEKESPKKDEDSDDFVVLLGPKDTSRKRNIEV